MSGFDEVWTRVALPRRNSETVSLELRPRLKSVYSAILSQPLNLDELKNSLENLLKYLSGDGRTSANCWATDLFFGVEQGWERDWAEQGLPEGFHDVLAMMGEALHDTVEAPEIAKNFGCLPEQLLERVRNISTVTPD